jgi:uncharacterized protein
MKDDHFEWDDAKSESNLGRHGVTFEKARHAFLDALRVIRPDLLHSASERRHYCFGDVDGGILTVRFTMRGKRIRIYGAAYWRKGRKTYETANRLRGSR